MTLDPILSEVRRVREAYAQQFNGDVSAMNDLRRRHRESDRKSATREPKPCRKTPVSSKLKGG
jgi:hypothetical protein